MKILVLGVMHTLDHRSTLHKPALQQLAKIETFCFFWNFKLIMGWTCKFYFEHWSVPEALNIDIDS